MDYFAKERNLPNIACYCPTFLKRDMRHIYRQITGLKNLSPIVLTPSRENKSDFPFEEKNISLIPKAKTRAWRRFYFRQLLRQPLWISKRQSNFFLETLREKDARLLHVYFGHVAIELLPVLLACPIPIVVSFHGADVGVGLNNAYLKAIKEIFSLSSLILARSDSLLEQLKKLGCPEEKLRLNRTGIPLEKWRFIERKITPQFQKWRFFQACRFVSKKGFPTTLRTFSKILKKFPEAHLTLAGEGPLLNEIKILCSSLKIEHAVKITPFLNEEALQKTMRESHFFIHPSQTTKDGNREGVPNAILEAMATGLPALSTKHSGIPEAVDHLINGLLVQEGAADALADGCIKLLESTPSTYLKMSQKAREAVEIKFSHKKQIQHLEENYQSLL